MPTSPIFIVGAERSGSTLLRLMLDSHPEITGSEGFEFMIDLVGDDGSLPEIAEYRRYLATHHIFNSSRLEPDWSLDYRSLVDDFLEQRLQLSGKTQVAAMIHWGLPRLLHLWPEARFIHLLRDPRDVAKSAVEMGWYGNVHAGVGKWIRAETDWGLLRPRLRSDQFVEVRFADLILDHRATLDRVCRFLDVPYTDAMLEYANDTDYRVPDPTKLAQWSDHLSDREVALVEARVGVLLTERGFEPSGVAPVRIGRRELVRLTIENRLGQYRRRLATFGPRLFVEGFAAKIVPSERYRTSVKLRYNEVERSQRKRSWRAPDREFSVRQP